MHRSLTSRKTVSCAEKNLFHPDNLPSHKIDGLRFKLLDPPYSPDLNPSNFLFPNLKIALCGQRLSSNDETITFVKKDVQYCLDELKRQDHLWEKRVHLKDKIPCIFVWQKTFQTPLVFFAHCPLFSNVLQLHDF